MATCKSTRGFFLFIVFLTVSLLSCEVGSGSSLSVSCKLDGESHEWKEGTDTFVLDTEAGIEVPTDEPYGFIIDDPAGSDDGIMIIGTLDGEAENNRVVITAPAMTIYSGEAAEPVNIKVDGTMVWEGDYASSTINITRMDDVGGLIIGTFYGTDAKPETTGTTVTEGKFMVRRVENYIGGF